jgi:SAM-dependent methyltransferase
VRRASIDIFGNISAARVLALVKAILRPRRKTAFLATLRSDSAILDVGCGNNSPFDTKAILPICKYTGIDVADYNQSRPNLADDYIVTGPLNFADEIYKLAASFDAVLSAHNLEHCEDRERTLDAMLRAVRPGGKIYLAFPCEESVDFPSREGTLNYFDDNTHKQLPPSFDGIIAALHRHNFRITFATRRYKPIIYWLTGLLNERESKKQRKLFRGTWEYYGFESIIWAKKHEHD